MTFWGGSQLSLILSPMEWGPLGYPCRVGGVLGWPCGVGVGLASVSPGGERGLWGVPMAEGISGVPIWGGLVSLPLR